MIPQAVSSASGVTSVGCIGNRIYTELGDDELYFAVPGKALPRVLEQIDVMLNANAALETFHRERAAALASRRHAVRSEACGLAERGTLRACARLS